MERILCLTRVPCLVLGPERIILQFSKGLVDVSGGIHVPPTPNHSAETEGKGAATTATVAGPIGQCIDNLNIRIPFVATIHVLHDLIDQATHTKLETYSEPEDIDSHFWRTRVVPIYDDKDTHKILYYYIEFQDVTEDVKRERALTRRVAAAEVYHLLVDTVKDYAIFLLDTTGHITTWNTGARLLKQYTADEIIGRHFSTFYSKEDIDSGLPEMELRVAVAEGKFEQSGWRYRKDHSKFWANVMITPSYKDGVLVGFTKVTRDMTENRIAQARLVAEYEEASKLKSQFLANMSHEIRSPMHGMLSAVTLLSETGLDAEQRELAGIIEESGSILLQVINDILDYSKLTSGPVQMKSIDMSIKDTVTAVIRSTKTGLKPGLELTSKVDPRIPTLTKGDPFRLRQILQNLVSNAVKFTEAGKVEVSVKLAEKNGEEVKILTEIADTGVGVPDEFRDLLFTPFTQIDNSPTKRYKGTGLGLSICKSLVGLMSGEIGFRDNPTGQGSIFWFTMKLQRANLSSQRRVSNNRNHLGSVVTTKRILLVEDNPINQNVMTKTLQKLGFNNIDVADDGEEGVEMFSHGKYDLVLMDISMPRKDGCAATRDIRAMGSRVPIVAMTANALKGDGERFIDAGMSDYIAKPVDRMLLVQTLEKWLG
jgi:osomolarity two-component system sensor histidine kinase TcsA